MRYLEFVLSTKGELHYEITPSISVSLMESRASSVIDTPTFVYVSNLKSKIYGSIFCSLALYCSECGPTIKANEGYLAVKQAIIAYGKIAGKVDSF